MKFLLLPFSWLYGIAVFMRNRLFDWGILRQEAFSVPVIAIGNLRVGGTGKTPAVEYVIQLLKKRYRVAVLSRGYGRKTEGWQMVDKPDAENFGDEPSQIRQRFDDVTVAVHEKRSEGIKKLLAFSAPPEVIILDDAMQHRSVEPGMLIMLSAYHKPFYRDLLLPAGRLREHKSEAGRAHVIIITKCPDQLPKEERMRIINQIKPKAHQTVFFAKEQYGGYCDANGRIQSLSMKDAHVLLVTGLADPSTLEAWVEKTARRMAILRFSDHHAYTLSDMQRISASFDALNADQKVILTTQKDLQRMQKWMQNEKFAALPIFAVEHGMQMFDDDKVVFENRINEFIKAN